MVRVLTVALWGWWLAGCDEPTGIVVDVRGMQDATELRLSVGTFVEEHRFAAQPETSAIAEPGPYRDGFEIYLPRAALLKQKSVALVLDASIPVGNGAVEVHRADYSLAPETGALLQVRLAPAPTEPGRWVCAGRAGGEGFTILPKGISAEVADCDRDGWAASDDLDDADPLVTGRVIRTAVSAGGKCSLVVGGTVLSDLLNLDADRCRMCTTSIAMFLNCLEAADTANCNASKDLVEAPLAAFANLSDSPDVTLTKLFPPDRVTGTFVPVAGALAKLPSGGMRNWRVAFAAQPPPPPLPYPDGWFAVTDRATSPPRHTVVHVRFGQGGEPGCEP